MLGNINLFPYLKLKLYTKAFKILKTMTYFFKKFCVVFSNFFEVPKHDTCTYKCRFHWVSIGGTHRISIRYVYTSSIDENSITAREIPWVPTMNFSMHNVDIINSKSEKADWFNVISCIYKVINVQSLSDVTNARCSLVVNTQHCIHVHRQQACRVECGPCTSINITQ